MRYAQLELVFDGQSQGGYIGTLEEVVQEINIARDNPSELDESWKITFVEMTEDEFNDLPEFAGW